ncbi:DUF4143 domain-containing protein [Ursidibacter arcticus]
MWKIKLIYISVLRWQACNLNEISGGICLDFCNCKTVSKSYSLFIKPANISLDSIFLQRNPSRLVHLLPKLVYSYKTQLVNPRKAYFIDNGLQRVISPSFSQDLGRKLENAVFWELRRQFSELYYYNENNKECDFVVCQNSTPTQLIQVCWQLNTENIARERDGLVDAMNFFKFEQGLIITFAQEDKMIVDGKMIEVVPFWKVFG